MMDPVSMAVVGASDRHAALGRVVEQNERGGVRMYLVNPNRDQVLGRDAYRALEDISDSVDVVLSMVPADLTVDTVERAAAIGASGVVITAAGFGETDAAGKERQRRIVAAAKEHEMAVCGPNCNGIVNVATSKSLCTRPVDGIRRGGLGLVSQSGGLVTAEIAAGAKRMLGFSHLISSGNEAVTDLVDYFEYLVDDPAVTTIMMIVEQIRRPPEFVAAAYRARSLGKPVIALKLGRSQAGMRMGQSHTGADMGDPLHYDALFRQVGVQIARDVDDLLDAAQMFSSLPQKFWYDGQAIGVLCASGGSAALASDAFDAEGLPLELDQRLAAWMQELIPTNALGNPFDTTGLLYNPTGFGDVLEHYMESDVFDTVLVVSSAMGPEHEQFCSPIAAPIAKAAERASKRLVVASTTASPVGEWTEAWLQAGVGVGSGIAPTVRSLRAMDRFVRGRSRPVPDVVPLLAPHLAHPTRTVPGGRVLGSEDAAGLLGAFDLALAPTAEPGAAPRAEYYVTALPDGDLGPVVVFGLGRSLAGVFGEPSARLAPFTAEDAIEMVGETRASRILAAGEDSTPGVEALAAFLVRFGHLAAATRTWLRTIEAGPLVVSGGGFAAGGVRCVAVEREVD
jgi:acyl-CoA synthetase (NDP forming)